MININKYKFFIDGYIKSNLDVIKEEAIPNKWDCLGILFGKEGSGKSTIATQICLYLDPTFNMNRCVFTPEQFKTAIDEAPPESAILWDEAITGANVSQHASDISIAIISKLTQIRKKRLKIMLCFPYLYMLNKYFVNRCLFSIYVYAKDFDDRGYGYFYSQNKTENIYNLMKGPYRYDYLGAIRKGWKSFYFVFDKVFCLPEKPYDEKKETSRVESSKHKGDRWKSRTIQLIRHFNTNYKVTHKEIGELLGVARRTISELVA